MLISQKYNPIYQLPYCCVPATLQWILYRRGLDILDQQSIGAELGLQLPQKGQKLFSHPNIVFTDIVPETGYGTQIHKPEYSIQGFFDRHQIPLNISDLYQFTSPATLSDFLLAHFTEDRDIIIRYHTRIFQQAEDAKNEPGNKSSGYGHFSVMVSYDVENGKITLGNPDLPFYSEVSLEDLIFAMSDQIDGIKRGLYIVS